MRKQLERVRRALPLPARLDRASEALTPDGSAGAEGLGDLSTPLDLESAFLTKLIQKSENFGHLRWLGQPIWQNILDLWTIQETINEVRPALLVETGTNQGGSALFYAHLFDLLGDGRVITCDVERMHDLSHPRIEFVVGSSVDPAVVDKISTAAHSVTGPVMAILDSNHSHEHVAAELELYAPLVTRSSYILAQDGVIDTLPLFREGRPGPLPAIREFLARHGEFELDRERSERFLISHHPEGWLRRRDDSSNDR